MTRTNCNGEESRTEQVWFLGKKGNRLCLCKTAKHIDFTHGSQQQESQRRPKNNKVTGEVQMP